MQTALPTVSDGSLSDATAGGLTSTGARARLLEHGPNEVESGQRYWALRAFLGMFLNPLILILLAASVISGLTGDALNATLIALMVLLSVALNFFQMFQSQQATSRLRSMVTPTTTVVRDGQAVEIPVREVVPGDLVQLRAGDLVPADATLVTATTLTVDEAALTGESLPTEKRLGDVAAARVFAGTSIVSGVGRAVVTATGSHTQFGAIARALNERAPASEFETGIRRFGFLIMRTVVALVLFVFLVNALLKRDPLESLLFALALAVGLTPEFLPMITTVTLGQGALRMARGQVIVKRLESIENLGSMDVLCSDKTGTLTQGKLTVEAHVAIDGQDSAEVLRWACINSALEAGIRSPLDAAILAHEHPAIPAFTKLAELPFDFTRRCVSVLTASADGVALVTKGAPESVVAICTDVVIGGRTEPFTAERQQQAAATYDGLSRQGYHVLAIAWKPVAVATATIVAADETGLVLSGFVAFVDPPDPSVRELLAQLAASGVALKILTGDNELVTRTICERVGLPIAGVMLGDELERTSDDALAAVVERTTIFARVTPVQKNRLIRALKRNRHVVGYLGDGINDAPSLHAADVGISVANAVDVAKAAADIILLERSLTAIHRGVLEGRRSFGNISKYVIMGTSSNFGNMLSMAVGSAFLPFLPLLPVQILLNNFLYDLSQVTIPTDNVDRSYVARPRKWDTAMVQRFMLGLGPISSLYDFLTFAVLLGLFHAGPAEFRAGWFIESLASQTLVIFVIRTAGNPFRSRPSIPLMVSIIGAVVVGYLLVVLPIGTQLGFTALPPQFFGVLAVMVVTYLAIVERVKRSFYRKSGWEPDEPARP
jgi:Mg2+-importing ATPase